MNEPMADSEYSSQYPESIKSQNESIKAQIYVNYGLFEEDIAPLVDKHKGRGYEKVEDDAYINTGQNSAVFVLEKNYKKYVAKVPLAQHNDEEHKAIIDGVVDASTRVSGIAGYEHVVAASPEGIIISEYVAGVDMADIGAENLSQITNEQIDQYVQAIIEGHAQEISIDPKPANVMYDVQNGFTIIDFGTNNNSSDEYKTSPAIALSHGIEPFIYGGLGDGDRGERIEDPARISEIAKIKLPLTKEYIAAVQRSLNAERDQELFLKNLDPHRIALLQREAFDMDGLMQERAEAVNNARESARNYNPVTDGTVDGLID